MSKTKKTILCITHSGRESSAYLFNKKGQQIAESHHKPAPHPTLDQLGECDPLEIIYSIRSSILKIIQDHNPNHIAAIGLCTAAHIGVIWHKETGMPIHNIILPTCFRNEEFLKKLKKDKLEDTIKERSGLTLSPELPALNLAFITNTSTQAQQVMRKKHLLIGSLDSWILYNLTGKKSFKTDVTQAAQTMLMNQSTQDWDPFLLTECGLDQAKLPKICPSQSHFGETNHFMPLPDGIPITSISTINAAAMIGLGATQYGDTKLYYSRDGKLTMNTGQDTLNLPIFDTGRVATPSGNAMGIESHIVFPEEITKWLPTLTTLSNPIDAANTAVTVPDTKGMAIVPKKHTGQQNKPLQNSIAIFGISGETTAEHLIRAYFEAIAFQVKIDIDTLEKETGRHIKELKVSGPLTQHDFLMQFQADILQIPLVKMSGDCDYAVGSAILTGTQAQFFDANAKLFHRPKAMSTVIPIMDPITSYSFFSNWEQHR